MVSCCGQPVFKRSATSSVGESHSPLEITPHKAAVIRDGLVAASWTIIDMSTQSRSAALSDGTQHLQLLIAEMLAVLVHEPSALCMNEIGHLEGGPAHSGLCSLRDRCR